MEKELYDKILANLKDVPNAQPFLNLLKVKDENEIEGAISKLNTGKVKFEDFIKDKENQSELDKLLAKAANTREEKLKGKFNFVKKESGADETDDDDKTKGKDSKVYDELRKLKEQVDGYERSRVLEKKREMASLLLKENKLPERFVKLFDFDSEDSIEDQYKVIEGDVGKYKDDVLSEIGAHGRIPLPDAMTKGKATESEINDIIKDL